jgi:hypothetical protein
MSVYNDFYIDLLAISEKINYYDKFYNFILIDLYTICNWIGGKM